LQSDVLAFLTGEAHILLALGGILLLAIAADLLGRKTYLPRVALLVALGVAAGPAGLDLLPARLTDSFELITNIALVMVGFLLGGRLTKTSLAASGLQCIWISITAAVGTAIVVSASLVMFGAPIDLALILGSIAAATAPASTVDTALESGAKGPFATLLLMVVALDDAWGLILFGTVLAFAGTMAEAAGAAAGMLAVVRELGGAVAVGFAIGIPAAYLTGRIRQGQPMLLEALGLVFACGGIALWFDVSFLLAAIVMGAIVANLAHHHEYPFHAIENVESPFLAVFFVVAGATLNIGALATLGGLGIVYMLARVAGKIGGAAAGAVLAGADRNTKIWMGPALLPQAGAAVGMALVAASQLPQHREILLPLIIGSTVIFELTGPIFTRLALKRTEYSAH
jgi:Kef-type K+ transport system membrane component KefB